MLPRAMLLQAFYSVRSERQLMERLEFDLLFRRLSGSEWTIRPAITRSLDGEIAVKFLTAVLAQPRVKGCCRASISRSMASYRGLGMSLDRYPFGKGRLARSLRVGLL
jgi:hypothetical protein